MKVVCRLACAAVISSIGPVSLCWASDTVSPTHDESSSSNVSEGFTVYDYDEECGISFAAPDSWQVFRVEKNVFGWECFFDLIPNDWAERRETSLVIEPEVPFLIFTMRNVEDPLKLLNIEPFEGKMMYGVGVAIEIFGRTWAGYRTTVQVRNHDKMYGGYAGYGEHPDAGIWSSGGTVAVLSGHGAYQHEFNQILASVELSERY